MKKFSYIIGLMTLSIMLISNPSRAYNSSQDGDIFQSGIASFYANKFNGRLTANGEIFSNN